MPEVLAPTIDKTIEDIRAKLHNGSEPTYKDIMWVQLDLAEELKQLNSVHLGCEARAFYKDVQSRMRQLVVGAVIGGIGLVLWLLASGALKLP